MTDTFEYNGFLVEYRPETRTYKITDISYEMLVGQMVSHEGPGWILEPATGVFLDSGMLTVLAQFASELNETLEDV